METKTPQHTEIIQQLVQGLGTSAVFGTPVTHHGTTIIPVARIVVGFGYGGGYGRGSDNAGSTPDTAGNNAEGGGNGGGGGGRSTPCGFIRIADDEVKYEPIADATRIPLAAMIMVAWIVFWVMATIRVIAKGIAKTQHLKWKLAQAEIAHDVTGKAKAL